MSDCHIINKPINGAPLEIIDTLRKASYQAYLVGGCVRDLILGNTPHDYDITTSATPEQIHALFPDARTDSAKYGTIVVRGYDDIDYEVTTFRCDGRYDDYRHPREVTFVNDLTQDLARRDFTVNAMALDTSVFPYVVIDPFNGYDDLNHWILRCVGNPIQRFTEDPLRILRAYRFMLRYSLRPYTGLENAIEQCAPLIACVSSERIYAELMRLFDDIKALINFDSTQTSMSMTWRPCNSELEYRLNEFFTTSAVPVLCAIIPELKTCVGFDQRSQWHIYDVYKHSIRAMTAGLINAKNDPKNLIPVTMLLHDIGKPLCCQEDPDGTRHFRGHPEKSAEIAFEVLRRLKVDNYTLQHVLTLIKYHDRQFDPTEKSVKRLINAIGMEDLELLAQVRRADISAQAFTPNDDRIIRTRQLLATARKIAEQDECCTRAQLAVNGNDIQELLHMKPCPQIGVVLQDLLNAVIDGCVDNTKDDLIDFIKSTPLYSIRQNEWAAENA